MYFNIAEHIVEVMSTSNKVDIISLVPSLKPFIYNNVGEEENPKPLLTVIIDNEMPIATDFREIGDFDTGNGHTKVEKKDDSGEYQFTIRNIDEKEVCWLKTNADYSECRCRLQGNSMLQSYGINSVLMLCYAFAMASRQTLLIHASCVKKGDYAYAFIAKSGTGKSTQVSNWLKHIPGCELLNDDNPIVRVIGGEAYIYGSPWSGKTPCYRNRKARLGAITRIERAKQNSVDRLAPIEAFTSLLPSCSTMKWEKKLYNDVMDTISQIIGTTGFYTLHCLPDRESAIVCCKEISMD